MTKGGVAINFILLTVLVFGLYGLGIIVEKPFGSFQSNIKAIIVRNYTKPHIIHENVSDSYAESLSYTLYIYSAYTFPYFVTHAEKGSLLLRVKLI